MSTLVVGSSFDESFRRPSYTTGRLLTAADLIAEQQAEAVVTRHLGRATGQGVVEGLEVQWSRSVPTQVSVLPGIGIGPDGQPIRLTEAVPLALVNPEDVPDPDPAQPPPVFRQCGTGPSGATTSLGAGVYVLTVAPATRASGRTAAGPLPGSSASSCVDQWVVGGVRLAMVLLWGGDQAATGPGAQTRAANLCLSTDGDVATNPQWAGWRGVLGLGVAPDELPLALLGWDGSALTFVDRWSVRRPPVVAECASTFVALVSDTRVVDGRARFLQFQEQLFEMLAEGNTQGLTARDTFPILPPAGILPVNLDQLGAISTEFPSYPTPDGSPAIDIMQFFSQTPPARIRLIDADRVDSVIDDSWLDDLIDLTSVPLPMFELLIACTPAGADDQIPDRSAVGPFVVFRRFAGPEIDLSTQWPGTG